MAIVFLLLSMTENNYSAAIFFIDIDRNTQIKTVPTENRTVFNHECLNTVHFDREVKMRRQQLTAVLLSMILAASAFLPLGGIQAMAAEGSAEQDAAVIQAEAIEKSEDDAADTSKDSQAVTSGDSSEKTEEDTEEAEKETESSSAEEAEKEAESPADEEAEKEAESSAAKEAEKEAASAKEAEEEAASANDEVSADQKVPETKTDSGEKEGAAAENDSSVSKSENAKKADEEIEEEAPVESVPSDSRTVSTEASASDTEPYLYAWVEGYEDDKYSEYQNIAVDRTHQVVGETYTINICTETIEGNNLSFEWYKGYCDGSPDTLIEDASESSYDAYLEYNEWNPYICKITDDYGHKVEILAQIYASNPDEFDLATDISAGTPVSVELTETNRLAVRFTAPENGTYVFYTESDNDTVGDLYDGNRCMLTTCDGFGHGGDGGDFSFEWRCSEGGTYYLLISDYYGATGTVTVHIDRAEFAVYGEEYSTVEAFAGEEMTLSVDADAVGDISYTWYRGFWNDDSKEEIVGEQGSSLTLSQPVSADYSCRVSYGEQEVWRNFSVLVHDLRAWAEGYEEYKNSDIQQISIDAMEADVTLQMNAESASDASITYEWRTVTDGQERVIEGADSDTYTFNIIDQGTDLHCYVSDGTNSVYIEFHFNFIGNLRVWPEGHEDLVADSDTQYQSLGLEVVGSGTEAVCAVNYETLDGNTPHFRWYDADTGNDLENENDASYTASGLVEYNSYNYGCVVTDDYGNSREVSFCINVRSSSENLSAGAENELFNLTYGETALLQVNASTIDGSEITYEWYDVTEDTAIDCSASEYETPVLKSSYHEYKCTVSDGFGNSQEIWFYVYVEGYECSFSLHPVDLNGDVSEDRWIFISVSDQGEITLNTEIQGEVPEEVTYQWAKYTEDIDGYENIDGETQASLTVTKSGDYKCIAADQNSNTSEAEFSVGFDTLSVWTTDSEDNHVNYIDIQAQPGDSLSLVTEYEAFDSEGLEVHWYLMTDDPYGGLIAGDEVFPAGSDPFVYDTGALTGSVSYVCYVDDSHGCGGYAEFHISVNNFKAYVYGSEDQAEYADIDLVAGQTQQVRVAVEADDTNGIVYNWSYDSGTSYEELNEAVSDTLTVNQKGTYTCKVSDQYNNSQEVRFYVSINHFNAYGNGDKNEDGDYVVTGANDTPLDLTVTAEADDLEDITYTWSYTNYNEGIYEEVISDADTSTYTVTEPSHDQRYTCIVSDKYGNEAYINFIIFTNNFQLTIDGESEGKRGLDLTTDENGDVRLKVNVTADDMSEVTIRWSEEFSLYEDLKSGTEDFCDVHLPFYEYDTYTIIRCYAEDQYGNSDSVSFYISLPEYETVFVTSHAMDAEGNSVPAYIEEGSFEGRVGQEVTFTAPYVEGYNFKGWYQHTSEQPYYTGEVLATSRAFTFTAEADMEYSAVYEPLGYVNLTINGGDSYYINGDHYTTETSAQYHLGTTVTLSVDRDDFAYWKNASNAVLSREKSYSFTVTSQESITAVFNVPAENKATLVFESAFGQVFGRTQLGLNDTLILPTLPSREGYKTIGWDMNCDEEYNEKTDTLTAAVERGLAAEDKTVTIYAVYELKDINYTITVQNGTGTFNYTYPQNEIVTVAADPAEEGKIFSHWEDVTYSETAKILSYSESYSFFADHNMEIRAVYVDDTTIVEALGTTGIVNMYENTESNKLTFVSMSTVPEGCTMDFAGIIATSNSTIGTDSEAFVASAATYIRGNSWDGTGFRYTWSKGKVQPGETWYVRAYLVYKDADGNVHTIYGDPVWQTFGVSVN